MIVKIGGVQFTTEQLAVGANEHCWGFLRQRAHEPSITRATSPWHSAHLPTSSKLPLLMVPVKLVIVTSWRHCPHQTLASRRWRISAGMDSQRWRAGRVKSGRFSTAMAHSSGFQLAPPPGCVSSQRCPRGVRR